MSVGVAGDLPWAGRCPAGMGTAGAGILIVLRVITFGAPNRTWIHSLHLHLQTGCLLAYVGAGGPQPFYLEYFIIFELLHLLY